MRFTRRRHSSRSSPPVSYGFGTVDPFCRANPEMTCGFTKMKSEAPPGFEPGMEVLQPPALGQEIQELTGANRRMFRVETPRSRALGRQTENMPEAPGSAWCDAASLGHRAEWGPTLPALACAWAALSYVDGRRRIAADVFFRPAAGVPTARLCALGWRSRDFRSGTSAGLALNQAVVPGRL